MNIIAKMQKDWIEPYARHGNKIPVIIKSDHPRFIEGTRFDWGFVQVAIENGYIVTIIPYEKNITIS